MVVRFSILKAIISFASLFFLVSLHAYGQDNNPFYILYNEGGDSYNYPASIYRLDHKNCELDHIVELNIRPHVFSIHDWTDIAISPEGTFYFIEAEGRVFEIDTITGELELYFTYDNPNNTYLLGLAIDYKGNFYALGQYEADIHIYYPETGEQYRSLPTASFEVGLDITFYKNRIFFHNIWEYPRTFLTTNLMGTEIVDSLFSHGLPIKFGGVSTYADSCQSHYILGAVNGIVTTLGYNQPIYEVHVDQDSIAPYCDRFLYPNPRRGVFGAAHRYENLASMPPVELQSHDYVLEYPDECNPTSAYLRVTASGGIDDILFALNDNNFTRDSVFLLEEPGWYEIIAKDSRSCFWTDSFYFDPHPTIKIDSIEISHPYCEDHPTGELQVYASGGTPPLEYDLNGQGFALTPYWEGLTPGNYHLTVRDSTGCLTDTTLSLLPRDPPEPVFSVRDEYCQASDGEISIVNSDSLQGFSFGIDGENFQSDSVFTGLSAGHYTVILKDSVGCEYSHSLEVHRIDDLHTSVVFDTSCIYNAPAVDSIYLTSEMGCDSLVIAHREPGEYVLVHLTSYDCEASASYTDSILIELDQDCDTLQIIEYLPAEHNLVEITRDSCSFEPIPSVEFSHLNQYGCDSIVRITYNHLMPDILLLDSIHCEPTIRDSLFYLNSLGCDSLVVIDYVQSAPTVDLGPDIAVPEGTVVVLQPSIHGDLSHFNWQPMDYLDDPLVFEPTARPEESILYTLEITDIHGCSASDQIRITVLKEDPAIYIPNAFSPNADGINDYFTAYFRDGRYRIEQLIIWDRWGGRIFNCTNHPCQWDGTTGGEWLPGGIYVFEFLLVSDDGEELIRRGEVLLVR